MFRSVADKISDAIEASYYVSPDRPGLRYDELIAVLANVGFERGEVDTHLAYLRNERISWGYGGLMLFAKGQLPLWLTDCATLSFAEDPRDRETLRYVQALLKEKARKDGVIKLLFFMSEVVRQGVAEGFDEHQVRLALRSLERMELAAIDDATGEVRGTLRTLTWELFEAHAIAGYDSDRDGFAKLLAEVRKVIELRSPEARWRVLKPEVERLPKVAISAEEELVLADIVTCFADSAASRSLDDTVRSVQGIDARMIALVQLVDKKLASGDTQNRPVRDT